MIGAMSRHVLTIIAALTGSIVLFVGLRTVLQSRQDLVAGGPIEANEPIPYFIADGTGRSGYQAGDRQLAVWALQAWQRAVGAKLSFTEAAEPDSLVRLYWAEPEGSQFGEMLPLAVRGRRGAAVYIRPDVDSLGPELADKAHTDTLMRDSIVYLTCLHELGHALGLAHSDDFRDIMYFFGYGGNVVAYFQRYRAQVHTRSDISSVSGLSDADVKRIRALYAQQ
jgi:hypothetical protein